VPRDTSLDEFGADDESGSNEADDESGSDPPGSSEDGSPPSASADGDSPEDDARDGAVPASTDAPDEAVAGAAPTHGWTPHGVACTRCGEAVEQRWRADDGGMVCDDCKEW
jgi:hypothetical protein